MNIWREEQPGDWFYWLLLMLFVLFIGSFAAAFQPVLLVVFIPLLLWITNRGFDSL